MSIPPVKRELFEPQFELQNDGFSFPIESKVEVAMWLRNVAENSTDGSTDSQNYLMELANNFPDTELIPPGFQEELDTIRDIASRNKWRSDLSPKSKEMLHKVCLNLPSNVAKKLDFSEAAQEDVFTGYFNDKL